MDDETMFSMFNMLPNEIIVIILDYLNFNDKLNARLVNSKLNGIIDIFKQTDGKEMIRKLVIKKPKAIFDRLKKRLATEIYYYLLDDYRRNDENDEFHANYYEEDVKRDLIEKEINKYMNELYPLFRSDLENHLIRIRNKILLNPKSYNTIKHNPSAKDSMKFLFPTFDPLFDQLIKNYFREYDDVFFEDRFDIMISFIKHQIIRSFIYDEFGKERKF
jgi:hypothetical protein